MLTSAPITRSPGATIVGSSSDVASVEQQTANAFYAEQRDIADPNQTTQTALAADATLNANAHTLLPAVFDSKRLPVEQALVSKRERDLATGETELILDGGIDWEHVDSVDVQGSSATATVDVQTWLSVTMPSFPLGSTGASSDKGTIPAGADQGGTIARPTNVLIGTVVLKKTNGEWLVDQLSWTFAPGSEP